MKLVTGQEMKILDQQAAESCGVPGIVLMEHASKAVADLAMEFLDAESCSEFLAGEIKPRRAVVLCGKGNNGGDGFGAARWLLSYGVQVKALLINAVPDDVQGDAARELAMYLKAGGEVDSVLDDADAELAEVMCLKADCLIDAMLGTGFYGELGGLYKTMCRIINKTGVPVLAVDVPTGVNADNGQMGDDAVRADATVTMGLVKSGLLLYPGRENVGSLHLANIGFPQPLLDECSSKKYLLTDKIVRSLLPIRKGNAHKGDAGRVVVAAGSPGYTGAAALASFAAVKAGSGLVSLVTPLSSQKLLATKLTEVMVHGLLERMPGVLGGGAAAEILQRANDADVLAIGPGLGTSESTMEVVREVLSKAEVPVVIDADALTALKDHTDILNAMTAPKVLTPHPGEMARLTGKNAAEIDQDRINIAAKYAAEWNAVLVLKGAPTVIGCPDGSVYVNSTGTSAMATGGSGDVLTGVIASLCGQGISLQEAALCGVYLHGLAGEYAADGSIGIAAGEISLRLGEARSMTENNAGSDRFICNKAVKMIK